MNVPEWMMEGAGQIAIPEHSLTAQERLVDGDAEFVALIARTSRFVFQVAYSILRNTHDAEDVAQETFLKVYRAKAWARMADERAFLARTAWRIAVDRLPRRKQDALNLDAPYGGISPEEAAISAD